jgi:hypothetical protein
VEDQPLNQRLRAILEAADSPAAGHLPVQDPEPRPKPPRRTPLGQLLVSKGLISEAVLEQALEQQAMDGRPLGQILLETGRLSQENLARTLTAQHGFDIGSLRARLGSGETDEPGGESTETFLVRKPGDGEPLHTARTFLDAADAAFELIEERDPDRLEIVRAHGGELENVWSYTRASGPTAS